MLLCVIECVCVEILVICGFVLSSFLFDVVDNVVLEMFLDEYLFDIDEYVNVDDGDDVDDV